MVATILKSKFIKVNPEIKYYQNCKKIDFGKLKSKLYSNTDKKDIYCNSSFPKTFASLLHRYASIKKKIVRYDTDPYITRMLRKAIMLRSKLKNKCIKNRSTEGWIAAKDKENFV